MSESKLSCKVCGHEAKYIGSKDLGKGCLESSPYSETGVKVYYYTCKVCGLTFTPFFDGFSSTQWKEHIYNEDYVLYDPDYLGARAEENLANVLKILQQIGVVPIRSLDYGAGNNTFAEKSRAESYDPYGTSNLRPADRFDFITCFEVAEHHTNPRGLFSDLESLLGSKGVILLTTLAINRPTIDNWYIGPRNGHCTIYNKKTLANLASYFNLSYKSLDHVTHLFYRGY